jgi:hypothetical protein
MISALFNAAFYFGANLLTERIAGLPESVRSMLEITRFLDRVAFVQEHFEMYIIPGSTALFLCFGLLLWLLLKASFGGELSRFADESAKNVKKAPAQKIDKKEREEGDRRLYLNLFSVLQREGRLMDFFSEDLTLYDDDQIGAAVRSIHENCKKTLDKHLKPRVVIDSEEGEEVTVDPGFDPSVIKLTGNVTGEPPFKGVLRHRGWKVTKGSLPVLSASQDSTIIAPAEVEIE